MAYQVKRNQVRCKSLLVAFMLLPAVLMAQTAAHDCKCRAPGGQMRDIGSVECVDINGKKSLKICVMSTNTPYWKKIDNSHGCPA